MGKLSIRSQLDSGTEVELTFSSPPIRMSITPMGLQMPLCQEGCRVDESAWGALSQHGGCRVKVNLT